MCEASKIYRGMYDIVWCLNHRFFQLKNYEFVAVTFPEEYYIAFII